MRRECESSFHCIKWNKYIPMCIWNMHLHGTSYVESEGTKWLKIVYKGVDISTEEKFLGFVDSINQQIQKQEINQESYQIKEPLDKDYLLKRYRIIVSRNKKRLFMAENDCYRCEYFQKLARRCQANCVCELEKQLTKTGGGKWWYFL